MTQYRYAKITSVIVPEGRQRKDFPLERHNELVDSIQSRSLLMAPVFRVLDDNLVLVAGERRLRAVADIYELGGRLRYDGQDVPEGCIPYTLLSELDPLAAEEAELDENLRRVDLTWQERAEAVSRLEGLRRAQAETKGAPPPTAETIAREVLGDFTSPIAQLGAAYSAARTEVLVARHLDKPEVRQAKTAKEAMKVIEKLEKKERREELAARVGETFNASHHVARQGDCLEFLADCPSGVFDVVLSDPPYGMGADTFGGRDGRVEGAHFYDDSYESWALLMKNAIPELYRVTKPDAHVYLFCDLGNFAELKLLLEDEGFRVFRTPLIWYKPGGSRAPWPEQGPQRKYEIILFAVKGDKKVTKIYGDVITANADPQMDHPAQKPVALYEDLLKRSVNPGDQILDFCAGSGPIFPAAHAFQCAATGVEADPAAFAMCLERLKELS